MTEPKVDERLEKLAELRDDFMRRWFGVAISVGFAATVVQMAWVREGKPPTYSEWEQIARLLAAGTATVLSWEGYLTSISTKKLYEFRRYLIDICLVFLYLFLLLTSKFPFYWLALHAIAFAMYIAWDFITASLHPEWYKADKNVSAVLIYIRGLKGRSVDRGLAITLVWAIYFFWLWLVSQAEFHFDTFVYAVFAILGLAGYRYNKGNKFRDSLRFSYIVPLCLGITLAGVVFGIQHIGNSV